MKVCNKCNIEKELSEFYKKPSSDMYRGLCKICHNNNSNEYYKDNKDSIVEYKKRWRNENLENILKNDKTKRSLLTKDDKDIISEYNKKWQDDNKEVQKEKKRIYYLENKEKFLQKAKIYRDNNKESIELYRMENKELLNSRKNITRNHRRKTDIIFLLECRCRTMIYESFKNNGYNKKSKTSDILGCSFEEFRNHLESKFEKWMNWENRGLYNGELNYGWDIDHIIPISSAKTEEEVILLSNYTNLQPLCSYTNRYIKRNTY